MSAIQSTAEPRPSPVLSIVVPAFNEADILAAFHQRLARVMLGLGRPWEVLYVDDGSTDATSTILANLHETDPHVGVIVLSRNFGKEAATLAGLDRAGGEAVVIIDADLQDPPELIPEMLSAWSRGVDVVYARRRRRDGDSVFKRATAYLFYRVVRRLGHERLPYDTGDFRLLSRRALEGVLQFREHHRLLKGIAGWVGFRSEAIDYDRPSRAGGQSKWNVLQLWNLALDGITGYTVAPLKLSTYVGLLVAIGSALYGAVIILRTLLHGSDVPGYPSLMVVVLFLGGTQMVTLGIFGEYLGRIFIEAKDRPLYLVARHLTPAAGSTVAERALERDEAVRWAYRLLLGREPESDAVVADQAHHLTSVQAVRNAFLASREFQDKAGLSVPIPGRFESLAKGAPRLLVISNCQGPEIAKHLACLTDVSVVGREVLFYEPSQRKEWLDECDRADAIITIPLSERFDGIRPGQLKERYGSRVLVMNPSRFGGLFPDAVILRHEGKRIPSLMGDHSKLTVRSFLRGETVSQCLSQFSAEAFERLGFFDEWGESEREFRKRDSTVDIGLADFFFRTVRERPLLVTVNHPTVHFYGEVCRSICKALRLPAKAVPEDLLPTCQAFWPTWPVFDFLAEHHGLKYRTQQLYVRDTAAWPLEVFIEKSFRLYATVPRSDLMAAVRAKPCKAFDEFLE